ncbi:type II CAAX endopeptidase family protein [Fulvivirgaceae bacterium BMA10]|uniref:Type II CAAX endopeptidase family protein n=1 Tax=Splendidivirga corallicola TaxID=3051826 RepID=A0ABT8KPY8_9BACT|nr:type II CAAX endopeptidase family protein [Fulvivirgaceae bacterium BMA10]
MIINIWKKLPILIRSIIVGVFILFVGQFPQSIIVYLNLYIAPSLPLFLPITLAWLFIFLKYLNGSWKPISTSQQRKRNLRAKKLPFKIWLWSLLAGSIGMIGVLGLVFIISKHTVLPPEALEAPFDLTPFPWWTQASVFLTIASTAGVVEEAAFRGYMLSQIQKKHGWVVGILVTGIIFYIVHLSHSYATIAFALFFLIYSIFHGVLVYLTRSIWPSIVLHTIGDFTILPMQYGLIKDIGQYEFVHNGWLSLSAMVIAVPLLFYLYSLNKFELTRHS